MESTRGFALSLVLLLVLLGFIVVGGGAYYVTHTAPSHEGNRFELNALHGLWGGYNLTIWEGGTVTGQYKGPPSEPLVTFSGTLGNDEIRKFADNFKNFSKLESIPGRGIPDESMVEISVVDAQGKSSSVSQPMSDMTLEFKSIYNGFIKIGDKMRSESAVATTTIVTTSTNRPVQESASEATTTAYGDWKTCSGTSFEFKYPPVLAVSQRDGFVILSHGVVYPHPNLCDMKGDAPPQSEVTDFQLFLKVFDQDLHSTLEARKENYILENKDFFENGTFKVSPGIIDSFTTGSLSGFSMTMGVEGCGGVTYYLPVTSTKTVVISRPWVPEFNAIGTEYQKKYRNLPGIILPAQEEALFMGILSSLIVK